MTWVSEIPFYGVIAKYNDRGSRNYEINYRKKVIEIFFFVIKCRTLQTYQNNAIHHSKSIERQILGMIASLI